MPAENFVCTSLSDKSAVHDGGNSIPSAVIHGFLFAPEGMAGENASKEIFEKSGFMSVPVRLQTRSTRASRCCGRAIQENMRRKMDQMFYRDGPHGPGWSGYFALRLRPRHVGCDPEARCGGPTRHKLRPGRRRRWQ